MTPKTKGCALIAAIVLGLPCACLAVLPMQSLPRARVGVVGTVEGELPSPVRLTVSLPSGAGLTASERRVGLPDLNEPQTAEVMLGPDFVADLPNPMWYCVTTIWWQRAPPPAVWLILRFEDAPDEVHLVGSQQHYVRGPAEEDAVWEVEVRGLERVRDGQKHPRYRLRLRLTRRERRPMPTVTGRAAA